MKNPLATKLYYSISEVAEITGLQPYTLRAWEKEFSCLRPRRARGKNRAYRARDIGIIQLIKQLLYDEGYTTKGVKQKLKNEPELLQANSEIRPEKNVEDDEPKKDGNAPAEEVVGIRAEYKDSAEQTKGREDLVQTDIARDKKAKSKDELRSLLDEARSELREILRML